MHRARTVIDSTRGNTDATIDLAGWRVFKPVDIHAAKVANAIDHEHAHKAIKQVHEGWQRQAGVVMAPQACELAKIHMSTVCMEHEAGIFTMYSFGNMLFKERHHECAGMQALSNMQHDLLRLCHDKPMIPHYAMIDPYMHHIKSIHNAHVSTIDMRHGHMHKVRLMPNATQPQSMPAMPESTKEFDAMAHLARNHMTGPKDIVKFTGQEHAFKVNFHAMASIDPMDMHMPACFYTTPSETMTIGMAVQDMFRAQCSIGAKVRPSKYSMAPKVYDNTMQLPVDIDMILPASMSKDLVMGQRVQSHTASMTLIEESKFIEPNMTANSMNCMAAHYAQTHGSGMQGVASTDIVDARVIYMVERMQIDIDIKNMDGTIDTSKTFFMDHQTVMVKNTMSNGAVRHDIMRPSAVRKLQDHFMSKMGRSTRPREAMAIIGYKVKGECAVETKESKATTRMFVSMKSKALAVLPTMQVADNVQK